MSDAPEKPTSKIDPTTDEGRAKIKAAAHARVAEEIRKAEVDRLLEEEMRAARLEAGLLEPDKPEPNEDIVHIMIDLPEYAPNIVINGHAYWHGYGYDVKRSVAEGLREIMANAYRHALIVEGKWQDPQVKRNVRIGKRGVSSMPEAGFGSF